MVALRRVPKVERRKNPSRVRTSSAAIARAERKYRDFHWGDEPRKNVVKKVSKPPKIGFKLGKLHSVAYETHKDGEKAIWEHEFGEEGGRQPDLVADSRTGRLHIVGGSYMVKPEGIVD